MKIRFVENNDVNEIINIYRPYVDNTIISFELKTPTLEEMENRIETITSKYPYIVLESNKKIIGYAYASSYKGREAYDTSVELSVYLDNAHLGQGLGSKLTKTLLDLLKFQGFKMAYSCVACPNISSEALHQKFGFNEIGTFKDSGYKFNKFIDVKWFEIQLNEKYECIKEINDVKNYLLNVEI